MTQPASGAPEVQISVKPDAALVDPTKPVVTAVQDDDAVLARLGAETDAARKAKASADPDAPADGEEVDHGSEAPRDPSQEEAAEGTPTEEEQQAAQTPIDRARAAAAKARESAGRNRQLMEQQKALERQTAQAQQRIAQLQHENEQARRFQAQLAQDPYAALKQLGMTEEQLAHRAVREGTPEAMIAKIQEQLRQERAERIALESRLVEEKRAIAVRQGENAFVQLTADDSKYPHLSELPPRTVLLLAKAEVESLVAQGYDVSDFPDADLAKLVEHNLATGKRKKAPPAGTQDAQSKPGQKAPPARTLTNSLGSRKASMPPNFDSLSQDEQFAHLGRFAELNLKK
jgi:hypothetical protein